MNDLAMFFGTIVGIILLGGALFLFEKLSGCWHKWGNWNAEETDTAYVQARTCKKCGYVEMSQWKKLQ